MTNPKSSNYDIIGVSESLTQAESHRLEQSLPILRYIQKNIIFSAKQLEETTQVSRDSIDKTIRKLEKHEIIEFKERKARGEKFYKVISKSKFNSYFDQLEKWDASKSVLKNPTKNIPKLTKIVTRTIKKGKFRAKIISEKDKKKQLWFVSKKRQKQITPKIPFQNPVIIWNLPSSQAKKIIDSYLNGLLCDTCFKENKISFQTQTNEELVCENGHTTISFSDELILENEYFDSSSPMQKRGKNISDSELELQKKVYLKNSKK